MTLASMGGVVPFLFSGQASAASTTVTGVSNQGWQGIDDNGHGGSLSYVSGPGTPPLGTGSAQLAVTASNQGYLLAKTAYAGTKLSDINSLSYSTYVQTGNNLIAPSMQLNVTSDVTAASPVWQGRLVYEPYMNGTVTDGTWQTWNTLSGVWWLTSPAKFGNQCGQSSPCTFAQLTIAYPNIGINTGLLAGVGFKAGSSWDSFVGNVDNFTFNDDTYDFEPNPAPTDVYVDTAYTSTSAGSHTYGYDAFTTIQDGIDAVAAGGIVHVDAGTYPITSATNVNKQVDIEGQSGATITTSGSAQILTFTAAGSKLNGFTITKTDKTSQNIIGIQANNVTISNNTISGQFVLGDGEVARALEVSPSVLNTTITDNNITKLRQPAYLNNNATGQINNNYVDGTKGWVVVANSNFSFNGNTWGTNATDIAIIDNDANPATPVTNNYTCAVMQTIRANNNNASIDNQVITSPCALDAPTNLTPPDGTYTNDPAFVDTWSAVAGATGYEYRTSNTLNGSDLGTIIYSDSASSQPSRYSTSNGTVTRQNGGTPEGTYYWQVRATGPNGAVSDWSVINKVVVDTTNPSLPTLQTPPNNGYEKTNDFYFTWSASTDNSPVTYEFQSDSDGSFTNPWDSIANGNSEQNNLTSPKIHSTGAPDGTYYWRVRAIDAAGNKSAWTSPWKMTIDSQAPSTVTNLRLNDAANQPIANGGVTNSYSVTALWDSVSDADHYVYKVWDNIPGNAYGSEAQAYTVDTSSTSRGGDFNQGEGTYYIEIAAVDAAGNQSGWSSPFSVTYDATAPSVPTLLSPDNNSFVTTHDFTFDWSDSTDANGPAQYEWEASLSPTLNADGSFQSPLASHTLSTSEVASPGTPDGTYYWHVRALDTAGNTSDWSTVWNVTVDTNAPAQPVATPGAGTYTSTQLVSLSSTDSSSIYYTTDGSTPSKTNGTLYSGAFTVSGSETVMAIAYDAAGNASPVLTAVYTITPPPAINTTTNTTTFTFTNTNTQFARTGTAQVLGDTTGGNAQSGDATNNNTTKVLSDNTTTPSSGQVKSDDTTNTKTDTIKNSNFMVLGWWWILVLAAILGFFLFIGGRRLNSDDKA